MGMQITLSYSEKLDLKARHKKSRDKRECDRIKAILLFAEDWSIDRIAQAVFKHPTRIIRHLNDYISSKKTTSDNGGSSSCLTDEQTNQVIIYLSEHTYFHIHEICRYIKETFDVHYSIPGIHQWLHRNKFSYKQPKGVPHKYDSESRMTSSRFMKP